MSQHEIPMAAGGGRGSPGRIAAGVQQVGPARTGDGPGTAARRVQGARAVEKIVLTGRRGPGWVEIVSGLNPGEPVVLDPSGLRTGQPVSVQAAASPEPRREPPAANGP